MTKGIENALGEVKSAYRGVKELGVVMQGIALTMTTVGLVILAAVVIFYPFILVWCINTLFTTNIPYSFYTWLASAMLYWGFIRRRK